MVTKSQLMVLILDYNEWLKFARSPLPKLALVMDFAVFVVHANESRLSINEDNAGIGYARFYRALLQKTGRF